MGMWVQKTRQTHQGFTIVELLIVIVVIAVLAAITVVAYNGIQMRAENTKTIQAVSQYVKALQGYAAMYNTYPIDSTYPCLGLTGTTCARVSGDGTGCTASSDSMTSAQPGFDTEMKKILTTTPLLSSQQVSCGNSLYAGGFYAPSTGSTASLRYFLRGDQSCSGIGGVSSSSKTQQGDMTRCAANLPSL